MAHALFAESQVDLAVIHALPNLGFTKGGVTDPCRMAALRDRHPGRFLLYATVDTPVADTAIEQLEAQVDALGVDGLKLYPGVLLRRGRPRLAARRPRLRRPPAGGGAGTWAFATSPSTRPSRCRLRPTDAFRVDDIDGALERFPGDQLPHRPRRRRLPARDQHASYRTPEPLRNLESTFSYMLIQAPASSPRR